MDWQRVTANTLPEYNAGDVLIAFGEQSPKTEDAYRTDAQTLHKHIAIYGDTGAMWWRDTLTESNALIKIFDMKDAEHAPEILAPVFKKSWTMREIQHQSNPSKSAPGFKIIPDWCDCFRAVWVNALERAIFTYCEGDLDLTVDDDEKTFLARLEAAGKFYSRY